MLSDPITKCLPEARGWNGIGGEYTIHLGEESAAKPGHQSGLPLLESSTSGFSRLWLGCASASAISVAGELTGPPKLLGALEQTLSLPLPKLGWEF